MNRLFNIDIKQDTKYTNKISIPQYLPSSEKPLIESLYNKQKYVELVNHINAADIPEEEKYFLKLAATRHIVFNYSKIADYYAHADKTLQKLMEESALVLIDLDDAIANGYVVLSEDIKKIMQNSTRRTNSYKENCDEK